MTPAEKSVACLGEGLLGQFDGTARNLHLLVGSLDVKAERCGPRIQSGRANCPSWARAWRKRGFGLQDVGVDFAAPERSGCSSRPATAKVPCEFPKLTPQIAVVGGGIDGGKVFGGRALFAVVLGGADLLGGCQVVGAGGIGALQARLQRPGVARSVVRRRRRIRAISWPTGSPMARTRASFCLAKSFLATISCCCRF